MRNSQVVNFAVGSLGAARPIHPQENFLRQLFGDGLILDHAMQIVHQRKAVFLEQQFEALTVSLLDSEH